MEHPAFPKPKVYPVTKLKRMLRGKMVATRLKLCIFRYVPYTGKTGDYYQGRAIIMREYYDFTLPDAYFVNLEDYKEELTGNPSN